MTVSRTRLADDAGAALISALMIVVLMAGLTASITALVMADTQVRTLDGTRTQAFYVTHAGLEKLTADLGDLFSTNFAPSSAQVNALMQNPPNLGATWQEPDGTNGYRITFPTNAAGNPVSSTMTVMSGPFQGLIGLATPYQVQVTGRLTDRSEASLTRTLQTVAIPVFQFGYFSENDLSFFAGPNFNFGGRVHSNASLYMASGNGSTLTLADRVTAVGEIIRTNLSNGWNTTSNYTGTVRAITAPNAFRNLLRTEGSLVGTIGSAVNEPTWTNVSTSAYNYNVANGRTGARRLDLPVVSFGAQPIDLIRRPLPNEDNTNINLLRERFYTLASLRILLSDTAADITGLPGVTGVQPIPLGNLAVNPVPGYVGAPFGTVSAGAFGRRVPAGTPVMGGFIKIERQNDDLSWTDVTLEILNLGIAGRQLPNPADGLPNCAEPNPDAILRLQRLRDSNACWAGADLGLSTTYMPNSLYDTREGVQRDGTNDEDAVRFGGVMHYIELDARNLSRWFGGEIGTTGPQSLNVNGYTVYFSDRRGNRNAAGEETGEYGFEDVVNPLSGAGTPNGTLDVGEDFNGNNVLDTYGQTPQIVAGSWFPLDATARPWSGIAAGSEDEEIAIARRNPPIFFRRALKLVNGSLGNLVAPGLTIASENPVYVQGNWNANAGGFGDPHVATAILADAVTLLSGAWNDRRSYTDPHNQGPRNATTSWYRFAVIAGKGLSFPQPGGTPQDFGTDGGAHNFLRYLEDWGGQALNFRGSIASFFHSRQSPGVYKCCSDVYSPPTRGYNFDRDFLTPALLPPRTPMFRDVNATGFAQIIRPR